MFHRSLVADGVLTDEQREQVAALPESTSMPCGLVQCARISGQCPRADQFDGIAELPVDLIYAVFARGSTYSSPTGGMTEPVLRPQPPGEYHLRAYVLILRKASSNVSSVCSTLGSSPSRSSGFRER